MDRSASGVGGHVGSFGFSTASTVPSILVRGYMTVNQRYKLLSESA